MSSEVLVEKYCGKGDYVYEENYVCSSGCMSGACVQIDLEISIATLKDKYLVGEKIELTDPPEVEGSNFGISGNVVESHSEEDETEFVYPSFASDFSDEDYYLNQVVSNEREIIRSVSGNNLGSQENIFEGFRGFEQLSQKFEGYLVEFEEEPVLKIRNEIIKEIERKEKVEAERGDFVNSVVDLVVDDSEDLKSKMASKLEKQKGEIVLRRESFREELKSEGISENIVVKSFENVFSGVVVKEITLEEKGKIEKLRGVKRVTPNFEVHAFLDESVPLIGADDVWEIPDTFNPSPVGTYNYVNEEGDTIIPIQTYLTGEGITIAIIDTGIDYTHGDLGGCFGVGCKVVGGYDFVNNDSDPMDDHGHGTHCAGISSGDGVLKGVAPDSKLYGFKVLDEGGSGYSDWIIAGIERSIDLDGDGIIMENENDYVDIISLSLGGWGNPSDSMSQAIDNVVEAGIVAVIAAGNDGPFFESIGSPGTSRKAITIGASNKLDTIASFSSRGPIIWQDSFGELKSLMKPDVTAPGVNICSSQWEDAWTENECIDTEHTAISGTSMATPHVAGAIALIKQAHPDWTPEEIKFALRNTVVDIGEAVNVQGQGRIDVLDSVQLSNKPLIAQLSPLEYNPLGQIDISGTAKGDNLFGHYTIYYSVKDSGNWNLICSGINQVEEGVLCEDFDTDQLIDGEYEIKLIVTKIYGGQSLDFGVFEIDNVKVFEPLNNDVYRGGDFLNISLEILNPSYSLQSITVYDENNVSFDFLGSQINDSFYIWNTFGLETGFYNLVLNFSFNGDYVEEKVENIYLDTRIKEGWPVRIDFEEFFWKGFISPIAVDLNNDGVNEIVAVFAGDGVNTFSKLQVYSQEGSILWSRQLSGSTRSFPSFSLGDLNNDGLIEIIFLNPLWLDNLALGVLNYDGTLLWTKNISNDFDPKILVSDLDSDGNKEIIIRGRFLLDEFGNPSSPKMTILDNGGQIISSWDLPISSFGDSIGGNPALGNFDDDSDLEIVLGTSLPNSLETNKGAVFVYNFDGSIVDGWPRYMNGIPQFSSPAIGDINNDGFDDVVIGSFSVNSSDVSSGGVYALNRNGSLLDGWPIMQGESFFSGISLGDINQNGFLEILSDSWTFPGIRKNNLYSYEGSVLEGWPIEISSKGQGRYFSNVFGDVNGDGNIDVLISINNFNSYLNSSFESNGLYAFDFNGSLLEGFPFFVESTQYPPQIFRGDNGNFHLLISSNIDHDMHLDKPKNRASIYVWELEALYNQETMGWPMFQHDSQHTGCYNCPEFIPRPQSKIVNNNDFDVTGNLKMELQKKASFVSSKNSSSVWDGVELVTNQQVIIPANGLIKLDVGGNYGWNLQNVSTNVPGDYRVYVSFEFGNQSIEAVWDLEVVSSSKEVDSVVGF